jgi:transcription initiation factor IIE alpha subunit
MKTKILITIISIGLFSMSTISAQEKEQTKMKHEITEKVMYTCPMNADVKSDKPGECPKCGMDLKKMDAAKKTSCCAGKKMESKKMDGAKKASCCAGKKMDSTKMSCGKMAKIYTCSMHPEIVSDQPGECSKCGMKLIEKKMSMKKEDMPKKHKH